MPATLHFFCGKAGAGKSTLAARLSRACQAPLIVEDVWMLRLYGPELKTFDDYKRFSPRLRDAMTPLLVDLLGRGQDVVLDFQANTRFRRAAFRGLAEQAGATPLLHWVTTPNALCLERIALRNVDLPEGSHRLSEADYWLVSSYFEAPGDDEGLRVERHAD